jgi:hypothetical protein
MCGPPSSAAWVAVNVTATAHDRPPARARAREARAGAGAAGCCHSPARVRSARGGWLGGHSSYPLGAGVTAGAPAAGTQATATTGVASGPRRPFRLRHGSAQQTPAYRAACKAQLQRLGWLSCARRRKQQRARPTAQRGRPECRVALKAAAPAKTENGGARVGLQSPASLGAQRPSGTRACRVALMPARVEFFVFLAVEVQLPKCSRRHRGVKALRR